MPTYPLFWAGTRLAKQRDAADSMVGGENIAGLKWGGNKELSAHFALHNAVAGADENVLSTQLFPFGPRSDLRQSDINS